MTTAEAAESGTVEAAHEAAVSSQEDDKAFEAEARELGWIPEEEFKGTRRPEKFKSAREFIEDMPPYVKKLLEKQEAKFNDRVSKLEKVNERTISQLTSIHKQEVEALKAERRTAIKEGDADAVDKIDEKIDALKADAPEKAAETDAEDIDAAFQKRNAWYGDDEDLTAMAIRESEAMVKAYALKHKAQMPFKEMIEKVEAKVKASAEYKAKFPDRTAANGHAAVDGGGEGSGPIKGDPLAKLPAEARAQAKADMKAYPKVYPDAASWLATYNS